MIQCSLCNEIRSVKNGVDRDYDKIIESGANILDKCGGMVVVPSLGALAIGHLLIVPELHVKSLRVMNNGDVLYEIIRCAKERIKKRTGMGCVVFEHSNGDNNYCQSACVDHAHVHIVPSSIKLNHFIKEKEPITERWFSFDGAERCGYTYLMDLDGTEWSIQAKESQLLRRIWCFANRDERHWNWRIDRRVDVVRDTIYMYNFDKVS